MPKPLRHIIIKDNMKLNYFFSFQYESFETIVEEICSLGTSKAVRKNDISAMVIKAVIYFFSSETLN